MTGIVVVDKLSDQVMRKLHDHIQIEMQRGLSMPEQSLRMLHSYIDHAPEGQERGDYLAIDFGGTNMRVLHVRLLGERQMKWEGAHWRIPNALRQGKGTELFGWMAGCVREFTSARSTIPFSSRIGFCFSFPIHQQALDSAMLLQWNKGFDIPECIGQDVAELLNDAFKSDGSPFRVGAIVNDAVSLLLARTYENPRCKVGAVLGTGFNAAYWEDWTCIPKLASDAADDDDGYATHMQTIINTEMGGMPLECNGLDQQLDTSSDNPGNQLLEKRVSGMYMGKLWELACRQAGLAHADEGYSTAVMSQVEKKQWPGWEAARQISNRSAQYISCALAAIIDKHCAGMKERNNDDDLEIVMEGSVIEKYFEYKDRVEHDLHSVFGLSSVRIVVVDQYSGIGAALACAIGEHHQRQK